MTIALLLLIVACICFVIESVKRLLPIIERVNFIAIGLALWSLSIIVASLP